MHLYKFTQQSRNVNVKTKRKRKFVIIIHVICPNRTASTLPAFSSPTVLAHATLHLFHSAVNGAPLATMEQHLLHPTLSTGVSVTHCVCTSAVSERLKQQGSVQRHATTRGVLGGPQRCIPFGRYAGTCSQLEAVFAQRQVVVFSSSFSVCEHVH